MVRIGFHRNGQAPIAQPGLRHGSQLLRGGCPQARQIGFPGLGVSPQGLAFRQHLGLTGKTAHFLDAAQETGLRAHPRPRQLIRGRPFLGEAGQFLVGHCLDTGQIHIRTGRHGQVDLGAQFTRINPQAHVGGQLLLLHQAPMQPGGLTGSQHGGRQIKHRQVRVPPFGHIPHCIQPPLGHAILQAHATRLGQRRKVLGGARHRRPRRDAAERLPRLGDRRVRVHIPRDHQYRIGRAVVGLEPRLHVLHLGLIQIFHGADGGPGIWVTGGIGVLRNQLPHLAVGRAFTLAFFIFHHRALLIELALIDGAQQVTHAVGLHP